LTLVGLEGERYDVAATRLGVPVGTVRSRLSRGRLRLRELIDGVPQPQAAQSRPSGSIMLSSGLIRRHQRSPAGRAGHVGDRDRSTPRSTAPLRRSSFLAPRSRNALGNARLKGGSAPPSQTLAPVTRHASVARARSSIRRTMSRTSAVSCMSTFSFLFQHRR